MKTISLTTIFVIAAFCNAANANIAANAESAGCNSNTIGATSGFRTALYGGGQ